jgi:hypothetical protein
MKMSITKIVRMIEYCIQVNVYVLLLIQNYAVNPTINPSSKKNTYIVNITIRSHISKYGSSGEIYPLKGLVVG